MVRSTWENYLKHVRPHSFHIIRNFLGCCLAEGRSSNAEDSDNEDTGKNIVFNWHLQYVDAALNHVRQQREDDIAITKA
eukprot:11414829-Karenia_brevis.AAC.1